MMTAATELPAAASAWSSFPDLLGQMNETTASTKQLRESSLQARKALADTTKQFKRSVKTAESAAHQLANSTQDPAAQQAVASVEALSKECRVTIKSYQEEIDNLTRRCKAAEQNYAGIGATLQELPDPAEILEAANREIAEQKQQVQQVLQTVNKVNLELEEAEKKNRDLKQQLAAASGDSNAAAAASSAGALSSEERDELVDLRREVAEYEVEFRSLKNQDITIRKLEEKIQDLKTAGAAELEQEILAAREELAVTEGRRASEALEREAAMKAKVQTLELQLRSERAGREATQDVMLENDEGSSRREAAWEAQRQILVDDNERVRESLQTVLRERDELSMKLAAVGPGSAPPSGGDVQDLLLERNAYEAEVSELAETNNLLREEIRLKEEQIMEEKRKDQARIDALEREKSSLNSNLASLESQLSSAPSQTLVDNMKRELRILKRLEYNADDVDTDRDPEIARGTDDEKDLEEVLVAKLRRAESELVSERNSKTDLLKMTSTMKQELAKAETAKKEAEDLISSLENDLERAISTQSEKPTKTGGRSSSIPPPSGNPDTLRSILDPNAPPSSEPAAPATTTTTSEKAQDDHSVATIVMAQRDRLRARCEALEAERDSFKRELQGQVQAAESLKSDNTKLYEKVRYLQNYNKGSGNGRAYQRASGDRDLDLEALEQRYEASVDPFKQFSKTERQRKLAEMSPMERTVFVVAKTVLSTKEMRTSLFFYVVALHLLVFVTTYHWSHAGGDCYSVHENEQLSHLPPALPAHIQEKMKAADASGA